MKRLVSEKLAVNGIAILLGLAVAMHLLIVARIIPFDAVWGGRLKSKEEMLRFESVSIVLNLAMLAVVAIQANRLPLRIPAAILSIAFWLMTGLFLLNTVGNMMSANQFEKLVFTPVTALLAIFSLRLALLQSAPANSRKG